MATTSIEKYNAVLFEGNEQALASLSPSELERLERLRDGFSVWLDKPEMSDKQIRDYLIETYAIRKSQAYYDISALKSLLGNVRNASKEWHRYAVIEMLKKAYAVAELADDSKGMAYAAAQIGKITNLDKEDIDTPNWEEYEPQDIEASDNVVILDIGKRLSSKEKDKLRQKYLGKQEPENAEFVED